MRSIVFALGLVSIFCAFACSATNQGLHVIDLTKEPPEDKAITTDGVSCNPVF